MIPFGHSISLVFLPAFPCQPGPEPGRAYGVMRGGGGGGVRGLVWLCVPSGALRLGAGAGSPAGLLWFFGPVFHRFSCSLLVFFCWLLLGFAVRFLYFVVRFGVGVCLFFPVRLFVMRLFFSSSLLCGCCLFLGQRFSSGPFGQSAPCSVCPPLVW